MDAHRMRGTSPDQSCSDFPGSPSSLRYSCGTLDSKKIVRLSSQPNITVAAASVVFVREPRWEGSLINRIATEMVSNPLVFSWCV